MAGFVHFDPDKWEPSGDNDEGAAKPAKPAKVEAGLATLATLATLPAGLAEGLKRLADMAVPRCVRADEWPSVVADAARITSEGWTLQALKLGWSALDLFGAVTDPAGDAQADGLAVWLAGRKLLALTSQGAVAQDASGGRHYFLMPRATGARLLWALGRGR